jgi:hypothetical protein
LREWRLSRAAHSVSPVDWDALDAADQRCATPADAVGSDAARRGGGDSGSDAGAGEAEAPSSTQVLSFEERVARVLAASAAVLRRVPQQSGDAVVAHTTAGVLSPTNTGRSAGGGQSPSAASRTSEGDSDGDVLARWRRQRRVRCLETHDAVDFCWPSCLLLSCSRARGPAGGVHILGLGSTTRGASCYCR